MIQLESIKIRKKILNLCYFYEELLNHQEIQFREGNKETCLQEIKEIKLQVTSAKTFRIAFVGEYNSGKTSIINILTDSKLPISSTVATDKTTEIPWNNITIVDTPGLGSGLEEHDEITKEWLAKSDLLLYVLTVDLLTEKAGERLTNMLDTYRRDYEMMIVMNMIDQEGNDISAYRQDLPSFLEPRPLDLYYPVFISAKYREKSQDSSLDLEERNYFLKRSRFGNFVTALNEFILNRREKAALTTPITRLQSLSRTISLSNEFDKECALLDLRIGLYESALRDLKVAFDEFNSGLKNMADGAAGNIFMYLDKADDIQKAVEDERKCYIAKIENSVKLLVDETGTITENLQLEGARISRSSLGVEVTERIDNSKILKEIFEFETSRVVNDQSDLARYFNEMKKKLVGIDPEIVDLVIGKGFRDLMRANNFFDLTGKLVAKVDHKFVLKIGKIIGHQFKPWDAAVLASRFTKAVPFLYAASAVLEAVSIIRKKKKVEEKKRLLREFKEEIFSMLSKTVEDTQESLKTALLVPIEAALNTGLLLLKSKKVKLLEYSGKSRESALELERKRDECMDIFDEIYSL